MSESTTLPLEGKVALVTGAGRGIGRAIADNLAGQGAHVLCVSRSEASCGAAAEAIREAGGQATARAVDVADKDAVAEACEAFNAEHGAVDILINNAGITRDMLLLRLKDEDWDAVLQTNLSACFYWTKGLLHPMTRKRWGRIIQISSVVGLMGNAGQSNYAAAKAGMIGFTKSLAREVASRSLTVNAVAPGFIETDMTAELGERIQEAVLAQIPLKRLGKAEEVASLVGWLAGPDAGYVTGQTFTIDGGMVM